MARPPRSTPSHQLAHARTMRSANATRAEKLIWSRPRATQLGWKFRRQEPAGQFIVDFLCHGCRLIVEIDGGQHGLSSGIARDQVRDQELAKLGDRVLRFWNNDVIENIDGVMATIIDALEGSRK
jgi:very-short-patch-repair endonuclease